MEPAEVVEEGDQVKFPGHALRLLVVRALTPWTDFPQELARWTSMEIIDGRRVDCRQCHPTLLAVSQAMEAFDPEVVLWCRVASPVVPFLAAWHPGRTFILFNWDSPPRFRRRPHLEEALGHMDHLATSDKSSKALYLLPPISDPPPGSQEFPDIFPKVFDVMICVTCLYEDETEEGGISRHDLFRALDKSPLCFGLFGPDNPLAARYPRSFRGYLPPQDFRKVAQRSRLCLNLQPHSAEGYLNERACRILNAECPMVVDGWGGPKDMFVENENAFFLDPKGSPKEWVERLTYWASPACKELRSKVGTEGREWFETHATWDHWWEKIEPLMKPVLPKVLVVKPFCGLCNQIICILQSIHLAKRMGRRLWLDGFQPSFNVYSNAARRPIGDFFNLDAMSKVFEWPIQSIPQWFIEGGGCEGWKPMERASHAKRFKRVSQLLSSSPAQVVLHGGFIFLPDVDTEKERQIFLDNLLELVSPRVLKTLDWVKGELGLVPETPYRVIHLRIEDDMVAHLTRRSHVSQEKVRSGLIGLYRSRLGIFASEEKEGETANDGTSHPLVIATGMNLSKEAKDFVEEIKGEMDGVTTENQKRGIAIRLGKGREIAALIDFLICVHGQAFIGIEVSAFSEIIAHAYTKETCFILDLAAVRQSLADPGPEPQDDRPPESDETPCDP